MADRSELNIYPLGDRALVINFDQKINRKINNEVLKLTHYLKSKNIEGILYFIPAYCSLTIAFDGDKWNIPDLSERILRFWEKLDDQHIEITPGRSWQIPICYDGKYGLDLDKISREKKVDKSQIVDWHTSKIYSVYMLGFLPGFVYLGDLPEPLHCSRRTRPRTRVPARSVAIAGAQTGIYPLEAPGGWQVIGKTPIPIFFPTADPPFLFKCGDQVRFYPVTEKEYLELQAMDYHELKAKCLEDE
ncbi:MAG: 5-oxoprolinase subunit PxpB [Saprospiraceae bacterium]|nr:5-oxoprolinase subunit PxpB [Saprospiraceae bacterium]